MQDSGPSNFYPNQDAKKRGGFKTDSGNNRQSKPYRDNKQKDGDVLKKRPKKPSADPKDDQYKQLRIDMLATSTKEDQKDVILNTIFKQVKQDGIVKVGVFVEPNIDF